MFLSVPVGAGEGRLLSSITRSFQALAIDVKSEIPSLVGRGRQTEPFSTDNIWISIRCAELAKFVSITLSMDSVIEPFSYFFMTC